MNEQLHNIPLSSTQAQPKDLIPVERNRSILIALTERAYASVEIEAKARGVSADKLALAALADFLGRNAKTNAPRCHPLVLHFPDPLRARIVARAKASGTTVNRFMIETIAKCLDYRLNWHSHPTVQSPETDEGAP